MTPEQVDLLQDAYYSAAHDLAVGQGELRTRLRAALAKLEKCRWVFQERQCDEFEYKLMHRLTIILKMGERLESMSLENAEELAWTI